MDTNSSKRRKLHQSTLSAFLPVQVSKGEGEEVQTMARQSGWVSNKIPVEIFNLIIINLPRSTIQNMRLVNREFEAKVSEYLFKYVVVPFRPEIYGINSEPSNPQSSVMLQDKGMRIFQGFGRHIKHFAMSFEVDIAKLANPPVKHDHDTITTFWGSYKWPFQKYNRYAQLEGLEQKADETRTMTKAFQFIVAAEELGLSIDGGLGWLAGPDINQKVVQRGEKAVVFGSSRFESEPKEKSSVQLAQQYQSCRTELPTETRSIIQRMLREVGYRTDPSDQSPDSVQSDQGQADAGAQERRGRFAPPIPYNEFEANIARMLGNHFRNGIAATENDDEDDERLNDGDEISSEVAEDGSQGENVRLTLPNINDEIVTTVYNDVREDNGDTSDSTREIRQKPNPNPLKPNELTSAQKEMLLELEWAQRAFMQTFTIAVIDSPITFVGVKKLTIARLPNTHLPNLVRDDFWNSLPNLNVLSLGIIPDWRELIKLPTSWVQDNRLPPSRAVTGVFQLLFKQISHRQNIESLHFEWICGGEYAPGLFCRNQHVLAAPVVESINMVSRVEEKEVLSLPFIKYLSLKNCWFSPHIFTRFIRELKQCNLQSLTLDSVSLTAFIRPGLHPMPHANNAMHQQNALAQAMAANMGIHNHLIAPPAWAQPPALGLAGPPALPMPVVITSPNAQPAWLNQPRNGSWAHVIDILTPGETLADLRYARGFSEQPEPKTQSGLKELIFKSCGYVRLPLDFNQSVFNDGLNPRGSTPTGITKRINDYESMMMKSGDSLLGSIANTMSDLEVKTLKYAWDMTLGWDAFNPQQLVEAKHDGITRAGFGRFNGTIQAAPPEIAMTDL
ncbi:41a908c4-5a8f-4477-a9a3-338a88304556-CDS [Sclerotinia trifoliorum]|uniref:41a908c4-5a8f-4477-a9a3-338a88304556-CDS n=1 Tax=Sclerotinia trifoliorum TaxID=28548 RepID=A0A8H2ZW63_9HELO|nr:41a908c4-5a8f-4477-a9a3-338a88304556-CDS [Sclerotinia trifoliorum]